MTLRYAYMKCTKLENEGRLVRGTPDDLDGMRVPNADKARRRVHRVWSQDPALSSRRVEVVVIQVGLLL